MQDCFHKYIEYLVHFKQSSGCTVKAYSTDISQFSLHFEGNMVNLDKFEMRNYFAKLKAQGVKNRSIARKISAIKDYAKYLVNHNFYTKEQLKSILQTKLPTLPSRLPKAINHDIIEQIIEYIQAESCNLYKKSWQKQRDIAIISLIYTTGLRISEALNIKLQEFQQNNTYLTINGKGGKQRIVPIMPKISNIIKEYLAECEFCNEYLFSSNTGKKHNPRIVQRNLENLRKALNLSEYITPHAFRHSCATVILNNGGEIRKIQELLGHSSLSTTQIYTKVDGNKILAKYNEIIN